MVKCKYCNKDVEGLPHDCKFCDNLFCDNHRLPEDHECLVLNEYNKNSTENWVKVIKEYADEKSKSDKKGSRNKNKKFKDKGKFNISELGIYVISPFKEENENFEITLKDILLVALTVILFISSLFIFNYFI